LHLQNVVEDALDLCSIENGKFEVIQSVFDIRKAIEEVCQIMHFQVSQKGLYLNTIVDLSVPKTIKSD
jgi:signal transduction histidine kinase